MKYVLGFMFDELKNKVLLIKKDRPQWQAGLYNGIGGKIETETPISAMVREFKEETGIDTTETDWRFFTCIDGGEFELNVFYSFSNQIYFAKTIETEEVKTFLVDSLPSNIIPNLKWMIPLILDDSIIIQRIIKHRFI